MSIINISKQATRISSRQTDIMMIYIQSSYWFGNVAIEISCQAHLTCLFFETTPVRRDTASLQWPLTTCWTTPKIPSCPMSDASDSSTPGTTVSRYSTFPVCFLWVYYHCGLLGSFTSTFMAFSRRFFQSNLQLVHSSQVRNHNTHHR